MHYLYGFDAKVEEMRAAANELFKYAEAVEKHVQANEVFSLVHPS